MIYLYKNTLPNYDNNTHYLFTDPGDYFLSLPSFALSFDESRYTINSNTLTVKLQNVEDMDKITYVAWKLENTWRFFWVRSAVYQSGFAVFRLEVDLWATFISKAQLSNINVTRCNRNIGTGIYDPFPVGQDINYVPLVNTDFPSTADFTNADLSIVYVVSAATGNTSILNASAGSSLNVFANDLTTLEEATAEGVAGTIDNAVAVVGGIYGVLSDFYTSSYDANVIRAYLVPKKLITYKGPVSTKFISKPNYVEFGVEYLTPTGEVAPRKRVVEFSISPSPNFKYFVGTREAGLEVATLTTSIKVRYEFIFKQDGLQVLVKQGDRTYDITEAFAIGLTTNDANLTSTEQIAKTLQTIGGVASGVFQIMAGGAGYITGAASIAGALTGSSGIGNARYIPGGDAMTTFRTVGGQANHPFYYTSVKSVDDEAAHARLFGAAYNEQVSIDTIFSSDLLGSGDLTETLIAADLRVEGVPIEARNYIANSFKAGIYLRKI